MGQCTNNNWRGESGHRQLLTLSRFRSWFQKSNDCVCKFPTTLVSHGHAACLYWIACPWLSMIHSSSLYNCFMMSTVRYHKWLLLWSKRDQFWHVLDQFIASIDCNLKTAHTTRKLSIRKHDRSTSKDIMDWI